MSDLGSDARRTVENGSARITSLLSVLQLSDSAFPSGRYNLSHGLEACVQGGLLTVPARPSTLAALLGDSIRFGIGPSDGVALACAHRAIGPDDNIDFELVTQADKRLSAIKLAREAREASLRTGSALLGAAIVAFRDSAIARYAELVDTRCSPGNYAVVFGLVSASLGVTRLEAVASELYAFAAGWVAAAVRLDLIDHRVAQRLLHRARSVITETALNATRGDVAHISSCTPLLDLMAVRHEQSELRLFAT